MNNQDGEIIVAFIGSIVGLFILMWFIDEDLKNLKTYRWRLSGKRIMEKEYCQNEGCGMQYFHCDCGLKGKQFKSKTDVNKKIEETRILDLVHKMAEQSLDPETFQKWGDVKEVLKTNRNL